MTEVLKVGEQVIEAEQLLPLLAKYQMVPQLIREIIIDQAIAEVECTPEEAETARQQFYQQQKITDAMQRQMWLAQRSMTESQLEALTVRSLKIEKYKHQVWESRLESYFLQRKGKLDRVIYSLICTQSTGIAQEVYFRIQEGEQSFAELAQEYSQGPESQTGGLIGPVELHTLHPTLAQMLTNAQAGQLMPPTVIGEWLVIVRLEKLLPAQLDEAMRQRLLNECFNNWLAERTQAYLPEVGAGAAIAAIPNMA